MKRKLHRRWGAAIATAVAILATPAIGQAATRHASPGGDASSAATCPSTDPCDIQTATRDASVQPGDVVVLAGGNYTVAAGVPVEPFEPITIQGPTTGTRARIVGNFTSDGSNDRMVVRLFDNGSVLRDLDVELNEDANNNNIGVFTQADVTVERVGIYVTGARGSGILLKAGDPFVPTSGTSTLRDSVVRSQSNEFAIMIGGSDTPAVANLNVVNVTAVATAAPGVALLAADGFGNSSTVVRNSILASPFLDGDIVVSGADLGDPDTAVVDVAHSNFDGTDVSGAHATLTFGAGNQSAPPSFANAAGADFRQVPGSPTIGAGAPDPFLGSLDFDGQPRTQGAAPDMGADEAADPSSLLDFGALGQLKRKRTVNIPATCPIHACNVAVAANLIVKGAAKRATASKVIKLQNVTATLPAGAQQTLSFKLSKKAFKALRLAKKARLTVSAAVTVALGFSGTTSASFKFKKAGKK